MLDLESIVAEETAENDREEVVMGLIINSGQARSLAYAALKIPMRSFDTSIYMTFSTVVTGCFHRVMFA